MSHKPQKQRADEKREPVDFDDGYYARLLECINSGQVEADQYVAHVEAGDVQVSDLTDKREAA